MPTVQSATLLDDDIGELIVARETLLMMTLGYR
jgi:hypothetical protein